MRYVHRMNAPHYDGGPLHVEIDVRDHRGDVVVSHDPITDRDRYCTFEFWWDRFPIAGRVILNVKSSHLGDRLNEIVPAEDRRRCIILDASAPDAAFYRAHGWTVARRVGLEDDLDPFSPVLRSTPDPVFVDWDVTAVLSRHYEDIAGLVLHRIRNNRPVIFFDSSLYNPTYRANPFYLTLEEMCPCVSVVVKEHAAKRPAPHILQSTKPSALLLDFDGVLCPSGELHHAALSRAVQEATGLMAPPEWADSTLPSRVKLETLASIAPVQIPAIVARKNAFVEMAFHETPFDADRAWVSALLREIRAQGIPLALVTNANLPYVEMACRRLNIDTSLFATLVTNELYRGTVKPKPARDPYRLALCEIDPELMYKTEHVVVVEDSADGEAAGVAAGATVQLVRPGITTDLTTLLAQIWTHSTTFSSPTT